MFTLSVRKLYFTKQEIGDFHSDSLGPMSDHPFILTLNGDFTEKLESNFGKLLVNFPMVMVSV